MAFVAGRFDLQWADLVLSRHKEINLVQIGLLLIGKCMVIELSAVGSERLGNDVFIEIAEICRQTIAQKLLIYDIVGKFLIAKSKGRKD